MDNEPTAWAGAAARAMSAIVPSTVSPPPFAKPPPVGEPTTLAEADALRDWALTTAPPPTAAATPDQLARHLEFLAAALPSRANDTETGRKRFAVYASILAGRSDQALAFMARRGCETLDWFPTPRQCLDILAEYRPSEPPQAVALLACDHARHRLFGDWLADVRAGGAIGDVPDQWKRIAVEQGDVRRLEDGSYVSRVLYHGPPRPAYRPPEREWYVSIPAPPPTPPAPGEAGATAGLVA